MARSRTLSSVILTLCFVLAGCGPRCYIKENEAVRLYPSYGYAAESQGAWTVVLRGRIEEPQRPESLGSTVLDALNTVASIIPGLSTGMNVMQERTRPFLAEGKSGRKVVVRVAGKKLTFPGSDDNGYFSGEFPVSISETAPLSYATEACGDVTTTFQAPLYLVPPTGISIVSDIDDTIKITNVSDRDELVANTFTRPFRAVDGMAPLYQRWNAQGAVFHYLSASPWQLSDPLTRFLRSAGFPSGTLHLKTLPLKGVTDSAQAAMKVVEALLLSPELYKAPLLESLFRHFPERRFILVGDAGEKDPEIYADFAKRYPGRVTQIYIRDPQSDMTPQRIAALGPLPDGLLVAFSKASELRT
jgi:phosphatidate phosphatase APP1